MAETSDEVFTAGGFDSLVFEVLALTTCRRSDTADADGAKGKGGTADGHASGEVATWKR